MRRGVVGEAVITRDAQRKIALAGGRAYNRTWGPVPPSLAHTDHPERFADTGHPNDLPR